MTDIEKQEVEEVKAYMDKLERWHQIFICIQLERGYMSFDELLEISRKRNKCLNVK